MSIPGIDPIRHRRPFKCKPHLDYLGTANQGTAYKSQAYHWKAACLYSIDNQIRSILLRSTSEIYIPIHNVGLGKAW